MKDTSNTHTLCSRYLGLLGVERRKPSYAALREVVAAQAGIVPFENISKLLYAKRRRKGELPDLGRYLDGIERYRFGGTCYTNNSCLHLLLADLGYDVMLCGADMANPDVHLVNMVRIDDREFLIDAGYAAPFVEPLPRDLDRDYVVANGRDRYVLRPAAQDGSSRMDLYRDGELIHGYTAKPVARDIGYFAGEIDDSYSDESTFMNSLLLARATPERSTVITNLAVIESEGSSFHKRHLDGPEQIPPEVEKLFSIPADIVRKALAELRGFGSSWN